MNAPRPRYEWLGLDPAAENPSHFQLLGLGPDQAIDREQILAAANAQLAKLKSHRSDENRDAIEALIAEIKLAAKCLAHPESRTAYLNQLGVASPQKSASSPPPSSRTPADLADIPMAIPLDEPQDAAKESAASAASVLQFVPQTPLSSAPGIRVAAKPKRKRSRRLLVHGLSAAISAVSLTVLILVIRPDWRAAVFGAKSVAPAGGEPAIENSANRNSTPSNVDGAGANAKGIGDSPGKEPSIQAPSAASTANADPGTPVPNGVDTPLERNPSRQPGEIVVEATPPSPEPAAEESAAPIPAMSDSAVEFYLRATVTMLTLNDIDSAAEMYSRIDPQAVSDQRLELFLRTGIIASAYKQYQDWLTESAGAIAGGTALEAGPQKIPISVVEASPEYVVVRDRGVNLRFPIEILPQTYAWAIIEHMKPSAATLPTMKLVVRSVHAFDDADTIQQLIQELSQQSPADEESRQWKEALRDWLVNDRLTLLGPLLEGIDPNQPPITDAVAHQRKSLAAAVSSESLWHERLTESLGQGDDAAQLIRLIAARDVALQRQLGDAAICTHREIERWIAPHKVIDEANRLMGQLSNSTRDSELAGSYLVFAIRFIQQHRRDGATPALKSFIDQSRALAAQHQLTPYQEAIDRLSAGQ